MVKKCVTKPTLHRPATYEIKVQGQIDSSWTGWFGEMVITDEGDDQTVTILTGTVDQAALIGIIRRLYALGLPLISVFWVMNA